MTSRANDEANRKAWPASAVAAWLDWHVAMGVSDTLEDSPRRLYDAARPQTPAAVADTARSRHQAPRPSGARRVPAPGSTGAASARALAQSCGDLDSLEAVLRDYDGCPLKATATSLCFADGNRAARVMLIGEAPGAEEDRQGKPFVGQSGQLLDRMLATIGLSRRDVYITNLIFWRPPGNRPPTATELAVCQPFLERQIELLSPEVLVFLGGSAARALLGSSEGVTKMRGRRHVYEPPGGHGPIPALVTFHPAYLLRQPINKRLVWRDLLRLRLQLEERGLVSNAATSGGDPATRVV
jgi:DNA polymerase